MGYILYKDKIEEPAQQVIVSVESPHVVRIAAMGDAEALEINTSGFKLYLDPDCKYPLDQGEYEAYTTLYRKGDNWHELSDDGSVYTEPEVAPSTGVDRRGESGTGQTAADQPADGTDCRP